MKNERTERKHVIMHEPPATVLSARRDQASQARDGAYRRCQSLLKEHAVVCEWHYYPANDTASARRGVEGCSGWWRTPDCVTAHLRTAALLHPRSNCNPALLVALSPWCVCVMAGEQKERGRVSEARRKGRKEPLARTLSPPSGTSGPPTRTSGHASS